MVSVTLAPAPSIAVPVTESSVPERSLKRISDAFNDCPTLSIPMKPPRPTSTVATRKIAAMNSAGIPCSMASSDRQVLRIDRAVRGDNLDVVGRACRQVGGVLDGDPHRGGL